MTRANALSSESLRRQNLAREMTHQPFNPVNIHPLDAIALSTAVIPGVGDVAGLAADARMFIQEPESRTPLNIGLSLAGAAPFVPAASTIKRVRDAAPSADDAIINDIMEILNSPPPPPPADFVERGRVVKQRPHVKSDDLSRQDALFSQTADTQRGLPESAMLDIADLSGGGVYDFIVEHVGDISHRMSEKFGFLRGSFATVRDKVGKTLDTLESGFGFEREMKGNIASNFKFRQEFPSTRPTADSVEELTASIKKAGQAYADAHRKVPVFNAPQWRAREAAVAVGEQRFDDARKHLRWLKDLTDEGQETYEFAVSRVGR